MASTKNPILNAVRVPAFMSDRDSNRLSVLPRCIPKSLVRNDDEIDHSEIMILRTIFGDLIGV